MRKHERTRPLIDRWLSQSLRGRGVRTHPPFIRKNQGKVCVDTVAQCYAIFVCYFRGNVIICFRFEHAQNNLILYDFFI